MVGTVRATSVFCWDALKTWDKESQEEGADDYNLAKDYRYIRLSVDEEQLSDTFMLNELVILDKDGNWMKPVNASEYKICLMSRIVLSRRVICRRLSGKLKKLEKP